MTPDAKRAVRGRRASGALVALALTSLGLAGCGVVNKVSTIAHNVENNKNIIDTFTGKMSSGGPTTFEAVYATTGSTPATIVYAVRPPKDLAFRDISTGGSTGKGGADLIVNASGEFTCKASTSSSTAKPTWTCQKLGTAQASIQNQLLGIYTPAHWVNFLKGFSLAAGFAGDKVTQSNLTVNGFTMQCVDFVAPGVPGTSTICTTAQGILGYVRVASETTSFQIKSYSSSPSASLFELPAGAKVTNP
jgi:hypothetical protein